MPHDSTSDAQVRIVINDGDEYIKIWLMIVIKCSNRPPFKNEGNVFLMVSLASNYILWTILGIASPFMVPF